MATAIVPSKKPTAEQLRTAVDIFQKHQSATAQEFVAAEQLSHDAMRRQLKRSGLEHVSDRDILAYLHKHRKPAPLTQEQIAENAEHERSYTESLLRSIGTRLSDVGIMQEALADDKFDEMSQESVARFALLACVQASKELVEAASRLGFKDFKLYLAEMGNPNA